MRIPTIPLALDMPCLARVELFGHVVYTAALCMSVKLMGVDLVAVARVYYHGDFDQPSREEIEVSYIGHSAIYRIAPIARDEFAAAVGPEAMAAFEMIVAERKIFDGVEIGRSMKADR